MLQVEDGNHPGSLGVIQHAPARTMLSETSFTRPHLRHFLWLLAVVLQMTTFASGDARAGIPSPCDSTAPDCLVACPAGDLAFTLTLVHFNLSPWDHGQVSVDMCDCSGFTLCPSNGSETYIVDAAGCLITLPNPTREGIAEFRIRAGGTCLAGSTNLLADGILLGCPTAHPPIASPDQNGDLVVDAADQAILNAKVGTSDPTADFDCDNSVTAADAAILSAHLWHSYASTVAVPVQPTRGMELSGGAPNPFANETRIHYSIPLAGFVRLTVLDLQGRRVVTLVSSRQSPGQYSVTWDGRDKHGASMQVGVYVAQLEASGSARTRKIIVVR